MLQTFRNKKRSIFGIVIAGFCGLLMVPFGMDMIQRGGNQSSAIEVDGQEISYNEYYRRLSTLQETFRRQFGANYAQIAPMLKLEQRAADDLINGSLLDHFSEENGLAASTVKIQQTVASHPYFQGQMTQNSLKAFIQAQGLTGAGLEKITKRQIVLTQLNDLFTDILKPSETELEAIYKEKNRKAKFKYLEFKPDAFASKVNVSDEAALKSFYENSKESYRTKKKSSFTSVAFNPEEFSNSVEIEEEDIEDVYRRDKSKFYEPKQAKLSHILITPENFILTSTNENEPAEEKKQRQLDGVAAAKAAAEDALNKYKKGDSFAEVVNAVSQDEKTKLVGGDLGWTPYSLLEESVRKEVGRLSEGEVSQVIQTTRGFEIFKLEEVKSKILKPLDKVRAEIKSGLQKEDAPEYARIAAEEFFESYQKAKEENPDLALSDFAKEKNKKALTSSKPLAGGEKEMGITQMLTNKVLDLNAGSYETLVIGNRPYVVEVLEIVDSTIPEFETVKAKVIESYKQIKSIELAKLAAEAAAKEAAKKTLSFAQTASQNGLSPISTEMIGRGEATKPPFTSPDIKNAAFTLSEDAPVSSKAYPLGSSFYLIELVESKPVDMADFKKEKKELEEANDRKNGNGFLNSLVEALRAKKDFKVNPEIFEQGAA